MRMFFISFFLSLIILLISGFFYFLKIIKHDNFIIGQNIDGIAVLTGGKGRIDLGLNLLAEGMYNKLIISGVDKKVSKSSILPNSFQEDDRIYVDRESESTFDNAKIIADWAKKNKLYSINVITSYYHIPRSMLLLNKFSHNIKYFAFPVKREEKKHTNFLENMPFTFFLMEEYIKYLLSLIIIVLY